MAALLTSLTAPAAKFRWSQEAAAPITKLKTLFTTALVLVHPDPLLQFVVDVDASDTGVGVVLLQQQGPENKLHPF